MVHDQNGGIEAGFTIIILSNRTNHGYRRIGPIGPTCKQRLERRPLLNFGHMESARLVDILVNLLQKFDWPLPTVK